MVRPTRASYIGISQQWRASLTDGNSVTPAQVTSITVEDEFMNLTAWPTGKNSASAASGVPSGFLEREKSAVGKKRTVPSF